MIKGVREDGWTGDDLRFPTAQEALDYAADLQGCDWKAGADNRRAEWSNDSVNCRWDWVYCGVRHLDLRMSKQEQTRIEEGLKGTKEASGQGLETKWIGDHPLGKKA
jgi:hypothetical protein